MAENGGVLLELFLVFAAAKLAGEVFERLRQPAVIGELLVGIVLGPSALGWIRGGGMLDTMATVGIVVLLFAVGLETRPSALFGIGKTALAVAAVGVVVPFLLGFGFVTLLGQPPAAAMFVGAALVATSVGITARVLADAGLISSRMASIILAAAVIDDILGLLVLAGVTGVAKGGVDVARLAVVLGTSAAFVAALVLIAPRLVARHGHRVEGLHSSRAPLAVALAILLGLSALSEWIGLAAIVGAFFTGMAFAESSERWELARQTEPIADFLVPFFFVVIGSRVDVRLLASPAVIVPGLALAALAVLSKVIGCGLGALPEGRRKALAIGVGMVPRGEVGLIVASVGLGLRLVPPGIYAMVVLVTVVTTVLVPPVMPALFRWAEGTT
jgi:Kef-type K+ transport system membrane component KefB